MAHEPVLFTIGDLGVTEHWILAPSGSVPIAGSTWIATPVVTTSKDIPSWAIVCAILFFLVCLLGLLFLLVKEEKTSGYYDIQVHGVGLQHSVRLPVSSMAQVAQYDQAVNHARQLAYTAGLGAGF